MIGAVGGGFDPPSPTTDSIEGKGFYFTPFAFKCGPYALSLP